MRHPPRRHPAHGVVPREDGPTLVFPTVCTRHRRSWLADPAVHERILRAWTTADAWAVGRYVLMPDHLHLFAAPQTGKVSLDTWVRFWKSLVTRAHRVARDRWQADHWDRRLRRHDSYAAAWEYVRSNPVRAGLVTHPDDWPYQGECHVIPW